MSGDSMKTETDTFDGFEENFLLKMISDMGFEGCLVFKRWKRDGGWNSAA